MDEAKSVVSERSRTIPFMWSPTSKPKPPWCQSEQCLRLGTGCLDRRSPERGKEFSGVMESVLDLHLGDFELCQRWPSSTLRTKKPQVSRQREGQACLLWDRSGCYETSLWLLISTCPGLLWWCYLQVKSCAQTRKSPALTMTFIFTLESEQHVPFVSFNFCFQFLSPGRNVSL